MPINYAKKRKMRKAEKAETPADEKRESAATQRLESRMGIEKHCTKCGREKCICK